MRRHVRSFSSVCAGESGAAGEGLFITSGEKIPGHDSDTHMEANETVRRSRHTEIFCHRVAKNLVCAK